MKWNELSAEARQAVIRGAAARLAFAEDMEEQGADDRATVADLADFARGRRTRVPFEAIRRAVADPRLRQTFDHLLDRYAVSSLPHAAAAAGGGGARMRRTEDGIEIHVVPSSAQPSTIFVRLQLPAAKASVRELVMVAPDGELEVISLGEGGQKIQVLIERDSPEFRVLDNDDTKLWLR